MSNVTIFLEANYFAFKAHDGQLRLGVLKLPFICHPLEVVNILARTGYADNYELLAAAVLHDVVEDCGVKPEEIWDRFGATVAQLVAEVTWPKGATKADKIARAPFLTPDAAALKTADLISNLNGLAEDTSAMTAENAKRFGLYADTMFNAFKFNNPTLTAAFNTALTKFIDVYYLQEI